MIKNPNKKSIKINPCQRHKNKNSYVIYKSHIKSKYYYFSKEYFEKLATQLGGKVKLFVVMKEGVLYNAALFFITNTEIKILAS